MSKLYYEIYLLFKKKIKRSTKLLFISTLFLFLLPKNSTASVFSDSLHILSPQDTLFIIVDNTFGKYIMHRIKAQQTIYSLARFYGLQSDDLFEVNPDFRNRIISKGEVVKVPIPNGAIKRYKNENFDARKHVPVFYQVKAKETLYGIAKRYFKMPVDSMILRNNLETHYINKGQLLHIGWMSIYGVADNLQRGFVSPTEKRRRLLRDDFMMKGRGSKNFDERGVAIWKRDGAGSSRIYALHRSARINSRITVINPMNGRMVEAKVIGRIPIHAYAPDVIAILSERAAKKLDAKDHRFYVKINH